MYRVWVSWHDMFCIFLEPKQLQRSHVMWFFSEALYRWHGTYAFFCFFTLQMTWDFAFFGYVRHAGSIATASLRLSSREHISLRCTEVASPLSVQMFPAKRIVDNGESFTFVRWSANHTAQTCSKPHQHQWIRATLEPQACPSSPFITHRVARATEIDAEDINIRLGTGEEAWPCTRLDPKARRNS